MESVAEGGGELMFAGGWQFGCTVFLIMLALIGVLVWVDYSICESSCEDLGKATEVGDVCMCIQEDGRYVKP